MSNTLEEAIQIALARWKRIRFQHVDIRRLYICRVNCAQYIICTDLHLPQISEEYTTFEIVAVISREI